jgi:hypothetical protein
MLGVCRRNEEAAIGLVRTQLVVARTNIRMAKTYRQLGYHVSSFIESANRALYSAENTMWRFRLQHDEFEQMVAMSELVRMELAVLEESLQDRDQAATKLGDDSFTRHQT